MILQKDLIAESGLTRSTAETVLKRLRKRGEIEAVKDSYNHNRISYSDEDADKIRAEFAKVVERMNRHQESSPESREKEESKGKGFETPGSSPDKTVQDFVKEPGPEVNIGGPKRTETKGEKGPKKRVPLYKNPIVYIGAGVLLLAGLIWVYRRGKKRKEQKTNRESERTIKEPEVSRPTERSKESSLANQYRIM